MTVAPGHIFNSAAGLLAASGLPSICHDTKIAFNECTFGYVPHAGNTYYASRMPGDFGTFLTLTGIPMTGKDAIKIGLADTLIEEPETYEEEVGDIMYELDPATAPDSNIILGNHHYGIENAKMNQVDNHFLEVETAKNNQHDRDLGELRSRLGYHLEQEPFMDPRDRRADGVAWADLNYKRHLKQYNQARNPTGSGISFFDF
jgi:enoyl-CoA hydratase/carnithine racemase